MRILYLDCFAGVSGDMLIGALLDCGLGLASLEAELKKLDLRGYELSLERTVRCGITAAKFDVLTPDHDDHDHDHDQHRHHHGDHGHRPHDHHRSLSEILRLIDASTLTDRVKERASLIFRRLGEAEAKIHGVDIEKVHFHEVGAIDSIIDIVGAVIGLEQLGIDRIFCSSLHLGTGTFKCAHGTYPVPGPATSELLAGVPVYAGEIEGELVTPTGAAIVTTLASGFGPLPRMRIERVGYGAGTRKYERFPNVLRAMIGEMSEEAAGEAKEDQTPTTVAVIETNIDDLSPQVLGYLMETAIDAGALDLFITPVQMKKNRPGVLLTILCAPSDRERMIDLVFRETTTLGVRYRIEQREVLKREEVRVETPYGPIRVKAARGADGRWRNYAPEFEDCREAAERSGAALRDVQQAALSALQSKE